MSHVDWNHKGLAKLKETFERRMAVAADALHEEIRESISTACPAYGKEAGGSHSPPGHPPFLETGFLRTSVVPIPNKPLWWRVVAGAFYAVYLEFGTRKMTARPFMWPGMFGFMRSFVLILAGKQSPSEVPVPKRGA